MVGVGHSKVYRHDDVSLGVLSLDACRQAIADAGLTAADIDGVVVDPMQPFEGATSVDGLTAVTPQFVAAHLGLDVVWTESVAGSMSRTISKASMRSPRVVVRRCWRFGRCTIRRGGNLGSGRMHGVPHFMDTVLQVMGRSGPRQVNNVEIALVTAGGQPGGTGGAIFSAEP